VGRLGDGEKDPQTQGAEAVPGMLLLLAAIAFYVIRLQTSTASGNVRSSGNQQNGTLCHTRNLTTISAQTMLGKHPQHKLHTDEPLYR